MKNSLSLALFILATSTASVFGQQEDLFVPRFPIHDSPIELKGDVRPHQFVSAVGRASAWLGSVVPSAFMVPSSEAGKNPLYARAT